MTVTGRANVVIRPFEPGDETAFRELNEEWIRGYFVLEPKDCEILNDPATHILIPGGHILMAVDCERPEDPQPIGCCALLPICDRSFEVAKMCVAGHTRGQGIGRLLLTRVIEFAHELGAERLYLETSTKLANAIHLYRSLGFQDVPRERLHPSPYARAEVFLELFLRPRR